jgi:hypothetical protein
MAFPPKKVAELLARCHRRCCICHRFCGVKIETDHIVPKSQGPDDSIENAIPVCFECHAEIHSYNDKHPRGRKYSPEELKLHRDRWLAACDSRPDLLGEVAARRDVGPLQALIDELELNGRIAARHAPQEQGCRFHQEQFLRAISEGSISILQDDIRNAVTEAYVAVGAANAVLNQAWAQPASSTHWEEGSQKAMSRIRAAAPLISEAKAALLRFLASEDLTD